MSKQTKKQIIMEEMSKRGTAHLKELYESLDMPQSSVRATLNAAIKNNEPWLKRCGNGTYKYHGGKPNGAANDVEVCEVQ